MKRIGGIVLCGGRSSRMGRPKAWLPVGGEFLLQRVVRVVGEAVGPVVVVAAPGQDVPPLPAGVDLVRDEREGHGPLAGLAAGLAALDGRADAAYLSACDVPYLSVPFVRRMAEVFNERRGPPPLSACVPDVGGFLHPLAAVYRQSVLQVAVELLNAGQCRLSAVFDAVPSRVVGAADLPDTDSLRNVNTPEEYAVALRGLGFGGVS